MSDDRKLQQAVLEEFAWEPSVNPAHIGVTAKAGVVTLTGHVENYANKHAAETAARRVKGVVAVAEEIEVRLPAETRRGDSEIAAAAVERLAWDVSVPANAVQVTVEKGWVSLTGQVDWNYQKEAAAADIRNLFGVIGLSNQTTIKPRVNVSTISDDITHALHRGWFFNPESVKVSAEGGKIRLTGTVRSPYDRQLAAATAWAAAGATAVENNIAIV